MEKKQEAADSGEVNQKKPEEVLVNVGSVVTVEMEGALQKVRIIFDSYDATNDDTWNAHYDSPVAMALLSGKVGDTVEYSLPSGKILSMTIVGIE